MKERDKVRIPKKIHYCWFGGKSLPNSALKCIKSWEKHMPDYEIIRWDESNFNVDIFPYTQEAYKAGKYAFVSDVARFVILYNEGGVYFDTDVELIKNIDDILERGAFMGCENPSLPGESPSDLCVASGLGIAAPAGMPIYKEIIDFYSKLAFKLPDGTLNTTTVVKYITDILCAHGMKNTDKIQEVDGIFIYPMDYFCPKSTKDGKIRITSNTRSIHHYDQSWQSPVRKYGRKFVLRLGGYHLKDMLKPLVIRN